MSRTKYFSAAVISATILTAGGSLAQDAATTSVALPPELQALNMTDIETEPGRNGSLEVEGRTADGLEIDARLDADGKLERVEVDDGAMPPALLESMLPQPVRDNAVIGQLARIEWIGTRGGKFGVKGEDANGDDTFALFDEDGRLIRFGRGKDDMRRKGGYHHKSGAGEPLQGDDRRPGKRDDARGPDDQRSDAPPERLGDSRPMRHMPPADFDAAAVNKKLSEAGYKEFGFLRMAGPRITLEANNPQGEPVMLELDAKGEVIRETAR